MKLSKIFHVLGSLSGLAGVVMLLGAWVASKNGTAFGMTEVHLFSDAIVLVLIAIWLQISTIHHMKLEEKNQII